MKVQPVLVNSVHQVWPSVVPYLEAALTSPGGDTSVDQALVYVVKGFWQLTVFVEDEKIRGAALVEYINRANARVAFVIAIGGKLISTKEGFNGLKTLVVANGATKFEGAARESVARLWAQKFGVTEKYRIVEVDL